MSTLTIGGLHLFQMLVSLKKLLWSFRWSLHCNLFCFFSKISACFWFYNKQIGQSTYNKQKSRIFVVGHVYLSVGALKHLKQEGQQIWYCTVPTANLTFRISQEENLIMLIESPYAKSNLMEIVIFATSVTIYRYRMGQGQM